MKWLFVVLGLWFAAGFAAAELIISNRAASVEEIGYRPADGSVTVFNPPSLTWLNEKGARTYTVQWSRDPHLKQATTVSELAFNCYTHNKPIQPGEYFWRYKFITGDGKESAWSLVRSFAVSENAIAFPMPSRAERFKRIPEKHPRLFMRPDDLPKLRALAAGREAARFADLRIAANRLLEQPLTPEPSKPGSAQNKTNIAMLQQWWPNREQAVRACMEAETVAFVYLITGEKKYGEAARARVLDLARWDPDGPTNFRMNCEAAKPLLHRIARAYDWAHDMFTPLERGLIHKAIARRIRDAWVSGEVGYGYGHINRPYSSHGNRTWHKIGESGIAFLGEIPEAETWLDYAMNKFHACYPVWSDDDGGWHEGTSYFAGYMSKAVWWLQIAESALQVDAFKKPFFAQVGDYLLYLAPPNTPNLGFGDLSFRGVPSSWGSFMDYFIRMSGDRVRNSHAPYWQWWSEQCRLKPADGILGFLYSANLPPAPEAKAPTDLPPSKVFRGVGLASLHTTLLDSLNDVHFLFKSAPFGSQSHGHNPQNTFQLNAYGEALLTACVYRDWYGTAFHQQWVHQTVSQNGVLVDGKGQLPHSARARGRIVDFKLTPEWDYVVGDAVEAYEGRIERCLRHVLFVKPGLLLLYDDLAAPRPAEFQFMLHGLAPFDLSEGRSELHLQQPRAGVSVRYLSPVPLKLRQWDGFKPAPLRGDFPNQWHVEAATRRKQKSIGVLTLFLPHRGTAAPNYQAARIESSTAVGARVTLGGKLWIIGFRKTGVNGVAELGGMRFESAVLVRND